MPLKHDPEWEAFEKAAGGRPRISQSSSPVKKREAFDKSMALGSKMLSPTDPSIKTSDEQISTHVKIRVYTPGNAQGKLPVVIFSHGGGWLAGNLDTEDHGCRVICSNVKCIVVSVHYRLCPEVKFPVPVEDCWEAYQWTLKNADKISADTNRLIFSGGSAGGGIAVALTWRAVQQQSPVSGLVVMAPFSLHPDAVPVKYKKHHTSYVDNAGDIPVIRVQDLHDAWGAAAAVPPYNDLSWFPQSGGAEALKGFPPTYIHNTDLEAMRDDGTVLELELQDIGTPVKRDVQKGLPHYFWCFPITNANAEFQRLLVNGFTWVLDQSKSQGRASL